jgi:hypothetical protein
MRQADNLFFADNFILVRRHQSMSTLMATITALTTGNS